MCFIVSSFIMLEKIVETKSCKQCGISFDITDKDMAFYDKITPVFNGTKFQIPTPTLCPDCRQQRRLSFRNERKLYRRNCDATGKDIISIYSPDAKYVVYDQWFRAGDQWDPMQYGQTYDTKRSFFTQRDDLNHKVPKKAMITKWSENSQYTNDANYDKNCYLCFGLDHSEDCYYVSLWVMNKFCMDSFWLTESQQSYECLESCRMFDCQYCSYSIDCSNCFGCHTCTNCSNCFGCASLDNKSYCIFNEQYTAEEYTSRLQKKFANKKISELIQEIQAFYLTKPRQALSITMSESCLGVDIKNCKNANRCFHIGKSNDVKYCYDVFDIHNCYDVTISNEASERIYECQTAVWPVYRSAFCSFVTEHIRDCYYCADCSICSHCFGCVWLQNKEYCILNKQYTREEYEIEIWKIIWKMMSDWERWEFFPSSISPFGYNETTAQEYFFLTKNDALARWYKRQDNEYPINIPGNAQTIKAQDLPPNVQDITDEILNKVIVCEMTWRPFRIIKPELEFYRKHNLPLPRKHPDQRHLERMQLRNSRKMRDRNCAKCWADIKTTYAPSRPEIVYCETCYNTVTYW